MKFKRNKETGILEVWENGKKVGEVRTMGDDIMENRSDPAADNMPKEKRNERKNKKQQIGN